MAALTTNHSASSNGQPVLVDDDNNAYGPADCYPRDSVFTAANYVANMLYCGSGKLDIALAISFLRNAPGGSFLGNTLSGEECLQKIRRELVDRLYDWGPASDSKEAQDRFELMQTNWRNTIRQIPEAIAS